MNFFRLVRSPWKPSISQCLRYHNDGARTCKDQVRAINEKETKPASHVILDLDGVVLDSVRATILSHDLYLKKWKKALTKELRYEVIGRRNRDAGDIISKDLRLPVSGDIYADGVWQHQRDLYRKLKPVIGIQELLCYFHSKKIPIALVTSSHEKSFRIKTKKYKQLIDLFCHIVTGDDKEVINGKPDSDLFEVAASRFHSAPQEKHKYVVFESSLSGIRGAKKAGMQTIFLPDRNIPTSFYSLADVLLSELKEFDPADFDFPLK